METLKSKKIVMVTGGAGYVGSGLIRGLLQAGFGVVCVDKLNFGGRSIIDIWGHPNFDFINADITDPNAVDAAFEKYAYYAVVHLAAIVGDPACKREPELAVKTNREASAHLLKRAIGTKTPRFIFASTCSNYGKMDDAAGYVDEKSPLAPVSLYAKLKVEFENLLLQGIEKNPEFCPTALRFSTVYGMSPRMRFDLTVNEFTKELALGRELVVFGEQFWRPYCHVADFSRAMITVLQAKPDKVAYDVFNVGNTNENYTKKMIVDELVKQLPDARIKYVKKDEDPRDYRVKFDKIEARLGFSISKTVPEGIAEIRNCILSNVIANPDDQVYYNIPYIL